MSGRVSMENQLYTDSPYINYTAVYNSLCVHLFGCNPDTQFDIFIHCWSTDLEDRLVDLYKPKKWLFEDNRRYNGLINASIDTPENFAQGSQVLSITKTLELMHSTGVRYDRVVIIRPDVLLWKDMVLSRYDLDKVYVNQWKEQLGDFHFVMNYDNSIIFGRAFDSALVTGEGWLKQYILSRISPPVEDDIVAGVNQEVLRHISLTSIRLHGIPHSVFDRYGLSESELNTLVNV
jgi:hypothetical protein